MLGGDTMFECREDTRNCRIEFQANLEKIDQADQALSAFLSQRDAQVDLFAIRIILREAALNAVIHGNGKDKTKLVRIECALEDEHLVLSVSDEGRGFAWLNRPDGFDVTGDGGRGLALMKIYADSMSFNESGNQIVLTKKYNADRALTENGAGT